MFIREQTNSALLSGRQLLRLLLGHSAEMCFRRQNLAAAPTRSEAPSGMGE